MWGKRNNFRFECDLNCNSRSSPFIATVLIGQLIIIREELRVNLWAPLVDVWREHSLNTYPNRPTSTKTLQESSGTFCSGTESNRLSKDSQKKPTNWRSSRRRATSSCSKLVETLTITFAFSSKLAKFSSSDQAKQRIDRRATINYSPTED